MILDREPEKLQVAIDDVLDEMAAHSATTKEYRKLLNRLTALHKLRETPPRRSPDTLIQTAAYILGIAMIIRHEELNIITTKALSFVPRIR
jgi:predicted metal-dependent enzyme (double-stranded beta helix superfamily)